MADPPAYAQPYRLGADTLTLLPEGPARLDALVALIDGARHDLRLLYYIYADDAAGRRVRDAAVAAAARGVAVTLIVDGFGSDAAAKEGFFDTFPGVTVCRFRPRFGRRYLLRNHQKLALADVRQAPRIIVGGFNVEDDYFGDGPDDWRDLGLLVEGPCAARMAGYFDALSDWLQRRRGRVGDLNRALAAFSDDAGAARWLIGGPTRHLSPWAAALKRDLAVARRIDLIAGYFVPSPALFRRLRGPRRPDLARTARVVTAARSDNRVTIAAARFTYRGLLRRGVEVYEYARAKLHTKFYVTDDVVHVGSANLDVRSTWLNLELMLRVDDPGFARLARAYVEDEVAASRRVTATEYRARVGPLRRLWQGIAYVIVAVIDPSLSRGLNREIG